MHSRFVDARHVAQTHELWAGTAQHKLAVLLQQMPAGDDSAETTARNEVNLALTLQ